MANNRNLKAYARYDGSGRIIAGSNILAKSIPRVGNWKEIQAYACCNTPSLNPNCIYFTIEATESNLDFWFLIYVNDLGPDVTGIITWGDGTVDPLLINSGNDQQFNHVFPNAGLFSGTLCADDPTRITFIEAEIND